MTADIIDVNERGFRAEIVDKSHEVPVVVDFWAAWCGPCKTLTPILEKIAADYAGKFRLAKVNVEENQAISAQFSVRGIPDVKVFKNGAVVDGFTGAVSEAQARAMIEKYIVKPIDEFFMQVAQSDDPIALFEQAYDGFKDDSAFLLAYGRQLLGENEIEKAKEQLAKVPEHDPLYSECQHMISLSEVFAATDEAANDDKAEGLKKAGQFLYDNKIEPAMDALLEVLSADKNYRDGLARKAMIAVLALCKDKEIEKAYRRKFSMAINS